MSIQRMKKLTNIKDVSVNEFRHPDVQLLSKVVHYSTIIFLFNRNKINWNLTASFWSAIEGDVSKYFPNTFISQYASKTRKLPFFWKSYNLIQSFNSKYQNDMLSKAADVFEGYVVRSENHLTPFCFSFLHGTLFYGNI